MRVYIAYSIEGSEVYTVAWKNIMAPEELGLAFRFHPVQRMPVHKCDGIRAVFHNVIRYEAVEGRRVIWNKLFTKKGKPLRSPALLLKYLKELENQGWTICKKAILEKYYPRSCSLKPTTHPDRKNHESLYRL